MTISIYNNFRTSAIIVLQIKDLSAKIENKTLLENISLQINEGEIHLIMGPNGAGKSTLLSAVMGLGGLELSGNVILDGEDISKLETNERAQKGLFIGFQHPVEVPGVHMVEFLRTAHNTLHPDKQLDPWTFREVFEALAEQVGLSPQFSDRNLNEGFSGGEKKRAEVLQMLLLRPRYAFLDEIDSGLDIESLKVVFEAIHQFVDEDGAGVVLITHNPAILEHLKPTHVHLLKDHTIKRSGDATLASKIITQGYTL